MLSDLGCSSGQVLSKTKSVIPHFFYISDITNSSSFNGRICRKKSMLENFARTSLIEAGVPVLDCDGLFKDYELHKVQALSADIAEMDTLNHWMSKFVLILWNLLGHPLFFLLVSSDRPKFLAFSKKKKKNW